MKNRLFLGFLIALLCSVFSYSSSAGIPGNTVSVSNNVLIACDDYCQDQPTNPSPEDDKTSGSYFSAPKIMVSDSSGGGEPPEGLPPDDGKTKCDDAYCD